MWWRAGTGLIEIGYNNFVKSHNCTPAVFQASRGNSYPPSETAFDSNIRSGATYDQKATSNSENPISIMFELRYGCIKVGFTHGGRALERYTC